MSSTDSHELKIFVQLRKDFAHTSKSGEISYPLLHFHHVDEFFNKLEFYFPVVVPMLKIVNLALSRLLIMALFPIKSINFFLVLHFHEPLVM